MPPTPENPQTVQQEQPPPEAESPHEIQGDKGETAVNSETTMLLDRLYGDRSPVLRSSASCIVSVVTHTALVLILAMVTLGVEAKTFIETIESPLPEQRNPELLKVELEESLEAAQEITTQAFSSAPAMGMTGGVSGGFTEPTLDQEVVEQADSQIKVGMPELFMPSSRKLYAAVPEGTLGESRMIVEDYQQALDQITQEIMWMLEKGKVLVVWAFDESDSMRDDQKEIIARIDRVYHELGLSSRSDGEALTTAVCSFGKSFHIHTKRPTNDRSQIRRAIRAIPEDYDGIEMLCPAVIASINRHREYANRTKRQMALIVVTDESGDPKTNENLLEQAISEAKAARCRIYTLGREAVFGYPHARIRWIDRNGRPHWLLIDRGPETSFPEQLQTNGFHRRHDAFPSGFGPYEQTRLARESNGIFFMLPSLESNLVRGEKRRYELEAMRPYKPDLRSRLATFEDRKNYPLRTLLWKIISDLNPLNPQAKRSVELRVTFSLKPAEFLRQARNNQQKALQFLNYLAWAEKLLEEKEDLKRAEPSERWIANYDLIYAQVIAYQARIYEYGAYLEYFIKNPQQAAPMQGKTRLVHWDIVRRPRLIAGEKSEPYVDKAKELFEKVKKDHPGTPWAARAQWEINSGFGVELVPDYHPPYGDKPVKVPKY